MAKMDEDTLKALVSEEIRTSYGYIGGLLSDQRVLAMRYYLGKPYGDEEDESSQVVTREVMEGVESALPQLLKAFVSSSKMFEFEPTQEQDMDAAAQATDYINYVYNKDNSGFLIAYTLIKDALLQKNGVVKHAWEEKKKVAEEEYTGLTLDQVTALLTDETVKIIEQKAQAAPLDAQPQLGGAITPSPAGGMAIQPALLYDIKIRRSQTIGRLRLYNLAPEEFLISRRARSIEEARFCGHRRRASVSELLEMGFKKALVERIQTGDIQEFNQEATTRRSMDDEDSTVAYESTDPSTRTVWVTEGYVRCDWNGDGKSVIRQVFVAEDGQVMLSNEPWDDDCAPFVDGKVCILPHHFMGISQADQMGDLQYISSTLMRQILNNMYLTNNQRVELPETAIGDNTIDDLLTNRPGGIVRTKVGGQMQAMQTSSIAPIALPILDKVKQEVQARTGVVPFQQAMDADTLQGTATGQNYMMQGLLERIELMTRILAETAFKELGRAMLRTIIKHQDAPRVIRLRNKWISVDPRSWNSEMDVSVNVGLGTGNKIQQQQHLMMLGNVQKEILGNGNYGGMVTPDKVFNLIEEMAETAGLTGADRYFNDPRDNPQGMQPPAPPPNPAQMKAQAEIQIQQAQLQQDIASTNARMQADQQKAQIDAALEEREMMMRMQLEQQKITGAQQLEAERVRGNLAIQIAELIAKYGPGAAGALQAVGLGAYAAQTAIPITGTPMPTVAMPQ